MVGSSPQPATTDGFVVQLLKIFYVIVLVILSFNGSRK
jgi:hypothetical protein